MLPEAHVLPSATVKSRFGVPCVRTSGAANVVLDKTVKGSAMVGEHDEGAAPPF